MSVDTLEMKVKGSVRLLCFLGLKVKGSPRIVTFYIFNPPCPHLPF